jgi:hypothetical protein
MSQFPPQDDLDSGMMSAEISRFLIRSRARTAEIERRSGMQETLHAAEQQVYKNSFGVYQKLLMHTIPEAMVGLMTLLTNGQARQEAARRYMVRHPESRAIIENDAKHLHESLKTDEVFQKQILAWNHHSLVGLRQDKEFEIKLTQEAEPNLPYKFQKTLALLEVKDQIIEKTFEKISVSEGEEKSAHFYQSYAGVLQDQFREMEDHCKTVSKNLLIQNAALRRAVVNYIKTQEVSVQQKQFEQYDEDFKALYQEALSQPHLAKTAVEWREKMRAKQFPEVADVWKAPLIGPPPISNRSFTLR